MTKEEYLRKVADMQTDISAIKQEGREESKTCNACIHQAVCYRYSYGLPENYVDKCGDYLPQYTGMTGSGKMRKGHWIIIDDCEKFIAKCSECGRIEDSRMISKYPYCHCGARMVEPQEIEEEK